MAKSKTSFNKKEKEIKRLKQRQEKKEKMEDRKANAAKGKPLEDMLAYIDENGNLSSTPPDPKRMKVFQAEDMQISVPKYEEGDAVDTVLSGKVSFFNQAKGFGFITITASGERVFVHASQLVDPIDENDQVTLEIESGPRGLTAVNVKKVVK